jgi:hypothetical protein
LLLIRIVVISIISIAALGAWVIAVSSVIIVVVGCIVLDDLKGTYGLL